MCGIRCNFGIASAKAARSISRDGEFELAMSSDSSSDLRIDDSERRPLNTSHAATKSTTRDVFVVPAIVSFVVFSSFLSSFVSLFASKSAEDEDEIRRLRRRFPVARSSCSRRDGRSFVLLFDETFAREHERTREVIFRTDYSFKTRGVCDESARACRVTNAWQSSARKISGIV